MERWAITVSGTVQGVGFRPFVYGLARELGLGGFVKNQTGGVLIEIEGNNGSLGLFLDGLKNRLPALAHIDEMSVRAVAESGEREFRIEASDVGTGGPIVIAPDAATCEDCLRELFDPGDRRYRYPFLNCTNCGPRLTIVTGAPYDRARTTMAKFEMCADCRMEYEDPTNRRFHAQPTACPKCGPKLLAMDGEGNGVETGAPLTWFGDAIMAGQIGAMKGLGGYHLVCDAANSPAVAELRKRKHRYEKPFAVMVADVMAARGLCEIDAGEEELLASRRRPIVLLRKKIPLGVAEEVAPGNPMLGVMLPYTPLHHLLMREVGGRPLVMTSGNQSDEPIVIDEKEAVEALRGICDLYLAHDRPIHVRCDDSVTRVMGGVESPIRRSRGYAPQPVEVPIDTSGILAVGGQLKGTFALGMGKRAIMSHHMGDLDHFKAFSAFVRDIALYEELFDFKPQWIAHDLHPDYASTRYARGRGIECIGVQHHHAHMASCMAEHGLSGPVIGVSFDGTGYGLDGAVWGGEFLVGDYRDFKRMGHFRYVPMPGGEKAVREPWRMAASHLLDAQTECAEFSSRMDSRQMRLLQAMIERKLNSPLTSSVGRLFDAVASLIGAMDRVSYEGQAAIRLEELAESAQESGNYPVKIVRESEQSWIVDTRPIISTIAGEVSRGVEKQNMARGFHLTMGRIVLEMCQNIARVTQIRDVVLSGGSLMNRLMTMAVCDELDRGGFRVYRHRIVPPNDGGLCLGQLLIAASRVHGGAAPASSPKSVGV